MPIKNGINDEVYTMTWEFGGKIEPVKVANFTDAMLDDPPECVNYVPNASFSDEICGTFNLSFRTFKKFQRACYGWRTNGPLRMRTILRLWCNKRREKKEEKA